MHRNLHAILFTSATICTALSGCFWSNEEPPVPAVTTQTVMVEAFLSRASLKGTEFEQYKLLPVGIFVECGDFRRGRATAAQQGLHQLTPEARAGVNAVAVQIFDRFRRVTVNPVDRPGNNADLFDPGKATFTIQVGSQKVDIRTSVDGIERAEGDIPGRLKELVERLRGGVEEAPCGNAEFFGIGRQD